MIQIGMNQNLLARTQIGFRYQIYHGHLRSHPHYRQYVGSSDQERMESLKHSRQKRHAESLARRPNLSASVSNPASSRAAELGRWTRAYSS
jgi:hypothetical protein